MDKDKLIKEAERMWHEYCGHLNDDNFHWSFYWLIQQAERVEYWRKQHRKRCNELEKVNEKMKEYEDTLEDFSVYASWTGDGMADIRLRLLGERAKEILEGTK